jgi:GH35 family endo-1,4-beta-xylanase
MKTESRRVRSFACAMAAYFILLSVVGVEAQVIGVQFGLSGTPTYPGTGVFGETFTFVAGETITNAPLPNGVKISTAQPQGGYAQYQSNSAGIYDGAINSPSGGTLQITFSNLLPNTLYSIAAYGARDLSVFTTNTSTSIPTDPYGNAPFSPFQVGYNVVEFTGQTDGSGNLVMTAAGINGTGYATGYTNISAVSIAPASLKVTQVTAVQFGLSGTPAYSGTGLYGEAFTLVTSETFTNAALPNGVTLSTSVSGPGGYAQFQSNYDGVYDGAINSEAGGALQFTFSHLLPSTTYTIAGYGARDETVFTTNTSTSTPTNPSGNSQFSPYAFGNNVVQFTGTTDSSGNLVISAAGVSGSGYADGWTNISALTLIPQFSGTSLVVDGSNPLNLAFASNGAATGSVVNVTTPYGASFTQAWDINVTQTSQYVDLVNLGKPVSAIVQAGDTLVATVWYRRLDGLVNTGLPGNPTFEPNEANLYMRFQQNNYSTTSMFLPLRGRSQWRCMQVPFVAAATGTGYFDIDCAASLQEVQIAGVSLTDYGKKTILSTTAPDVTGALTLSNNGGGSWGSLTKNYSVANTGAPFSTADLVTVASGPGYTNAQECNLNVNLGQPVGAGDTLVAMFWMRRDPSSDQTVTGASGFQVTTVSNSTAVPPGYIPTMVDSNWQQFYIPFTASQAFAETASSNTGQLQFFFGNCLQKMDIGGVQLVDLGTAVPVSALSSNQFSYPGRALSEPWRTTAQANIQKYRTGTLTVNVLNYPTGIISGATVTANMTKPQFGFGSWHNWEYVENIPQLGQTALTNYQAAFSEYSGSQPSTNWIFNKTTRGDYKWPDWEDTSWTNSPDFVTGTTDWFLSNGLTDIRGHNLVWSNYFVYSVTTNGSSYTTNYTLVPNDVPTLSGSALSNRVLNHISSEAGCVTNSPVDQRVCGVISDWDVVNEPSNSRSIQGVLSGKSGDLSQVTPSVSAPYLTSWLSETAVADPAPNRYINDNGIELNIARYLPGATAANNEEEYDYELLTNVISEGGKLDGFGYESHFPSNTPPVDPMTENAIFARFGSLTTASGKPLQQQITEYEAQFPGADVQADYMADYLTVAFSQTNFTAFTMYGFWGGDLPSTGGAHVPGTTNNYGNVFNSDWSVSPAGEAYLALVKGQWWTKNVTTSSNGSGAATINGFLGRYALTVSNSGMTKIYYADMPTTAGAKVNAQMDGSGGTTHVWVYDVANRPVYPSFQKSAVTGAVNGYAVTATGGTNFEPPGETQGPPQLTVNTEAYGTVYIWFRGENLGTGNNAIWVAVDKSAPQEIYLPNNSTFKWGRPWGAVSLAAGTSHTLGIEWGAAGATLDQVLVTDDPNFTPTY